jgi:hypothetical protein
MYGGFARSRGEFWVAGFGWWGKKCCFNGEGPWNGKLFHVEQFEKGRNDAGFTVFLTVSRTVATVHFYGATDDELRWNFT